MEPMALYVGYRLRYLGENPAKPSKRTTGKTSPQAFSIALLSRKYTYTCIRLYGDIVVDPSAQYCKTFPPRGCRTAALFYTRMFERANLVRTRPQMQPFSFHLPRSSSPSVSDTLFSIPPASSYIPLHTACAH